MEEYRHIHTHAHAHTHIHGLMYTYTCTYTCGYAYTYAYTCTNICMHIAPTYSNECTSTYSYSHKYAHRETGIQRDRDRGGDEGRCADRDEEGHAWWRRLLPSAADAPTGRRDPPRRKCLRPAVVRVAVEREKKNQGSTSYLSLSLSLPCCPHQAIR